MYCEQAKLENEEKTNSEDCIFIMRKISGREQLVVKYDLLFDYLSLLCLIFHQTKAHVR